MTMPPPASPAAPADSLARVLARIDAALPAATERLFAVMRIPSVSAQPAHAPDCEAAARWFRDELAAIGFDAGIRQTDGLPVVVGHHPGTGGSAGPRVLYYGHYDVQPAEPLDEWRTPPFAPGLVPGPHGPRIAGRGAVDDKGQAMMWLEALRAWHLEAGGPPVPVTVLIEGEEEIGSPSLDRFLQQQQATLAADLAVISDTNMWDIATPAITTRLRGLVYTQIDLFAAQRDLHSGLYGGAALNPLNLLTRILGGLHDDRGRICLPGFYDGVVPVSAAQSAAWQALDYDEAGFLGRIGLRNPAGEAGVPALERVWARPTADLNGIWGGYTGAGSKTVIPASAHAKLSFRLVPGQQPDRIVQGLRDFLAASLPDDARVELQVLGSAPAIALPDDFAALRAAQLALHAEYGRDALLMGSGGSIPVVESFRRLLGVNTLMMGFGLDDDQVHSPNEKFEQRCFHKGTRSHARLLAALGAGTAAP